MSAHTKFKSQNESSPQQISYPLPIFCGYYQYFQNQNKYTQTKELILPIYSNSESKNSMTTISQQFVSNNEKIKNHDETLKNVKNHPRNRFTNEEDLKLFELVNKYGDKNWKEISSRMPGRNVRQCHDRWMKYLSPDINTDSWTEEEDKLLTEKFNELGSQWKQISSYFPNRTDISIRNRWQVQCRRNAKIIREKMKKEQTAYFLNELDKNKLTNTFAYHKHLANPRKFVWTTKRANENTKQDETCQSNEFQKNDEEQMADLFLDEWLVNQNECL